MAKNTQSQKTNSTPDIRPEESADLIALESGDTEAAVVDSSDEHFQPVVPIQSRIVDIKPDTSGKRFLYVLKKWKWLTAIVVFVVVTGLLAAIPMTRYAIASVFVRHSIDIVIKDSQSKAAVGGLMVSLDSRTAETDVNGIARFSDVPAGRHTIKASKDQYKDESYELTVPIFASTKQFSYDVRSTGKSVSFIVNDLIRGTPMTKATVKTATSSVVTDKDGKATLVIPSKSTDMKATITADNFRSNELIIDPSKVNEVKLAANGSVYFLSKESGTIDVIKTDLDGGNRKVILKGTGSEDDNTTSLIASQDWKYLALKSKRDKTKEAGIYTITTSNDSLVPVEQDNFDYTLVGWSGHTLIYRTERSEMPVWTPKKSSINSINADSNKKVTIDESLAEGNGLNNNIFQSFSDIFILDNSITYSRTWSSFGSQPPVGLTTGKKSTIVLSSVDGVTKKVVKSYDLQNAGSLYGKLYLPQELYYQLYAVDTSKPPVYAEFKNGEVKDGIAKPTNFDTVQYPTYIMSPDGNKSFWSEDRDGKKTLFIGDKNAGNKAEIAAKSDYTPYGWYGDEFLLVQKGGSELYITTQKQLKAGVAPVKVDDYHKPRSTYPGYGYGYGGQ